MPVKSINELITQVNGNFPDNTSQLITPLKLRQFCLDFLATMAPFYGQLTLAGPSIQAQTTTPTLLIYDAAYDSNPLQSTSTVPASTIARTERGSSRLNFAATFTCTNNVAMTFRLYKDGSPTIWKTSGVGRGPGNPVSVSMVAFDYADPAPVYTIRVNSEASLSATFTDLALLLASSPVNSFT